MKISGFELVEDRFEPSARTPRHTHERAHFCIALGGGWVECSRRGYQTYRPFTLGFLPSEAWHSLAYGRAGSTAFCMKVQADKLEGQRGFIELPGDAIHSQGGPLNLLFLRIYREFRQPDNVSHLAIEGLFLELLAEISRQAKPLERKPAKWLMRAREYLDENFDYQLRLDAVAKSVGVHPVHLAREFRRHFKLTVGEYIRSRRVEHACRQLTKPDISIAEIAVMTGFSDQSHLSRAFKKIMGTTPADYRRERRWQRYEFDRTK